MPKQEDVVKSKVRQREAVVPPPSWGSLSCFFFHPVGLPSLRDAKSLRILVVFPKRQILTDAQVFSPVRQVFDNSQSFSARAPNPRRSWGFQIQVPDPGLSMLVWQRAENDRKKDVTCVGEKRSKSNDVGWSNPVYGTCPFLALSAALAFGFFCSFLDILSGFGGSGPHHRCFPAFSRLLWAEHQRFVVMTFNKVKKQKQCSNHII